MAHDVEMGGRHLAVLALLGAGEGLILGRGLEICFGIDRYLLIALFGLLGGLGIGTIAWVTIGWWRLTAAGRKVEARTRKLKLVLSSVVPVLAVFGAFFLVRVLPLILEEIKYSR